MTTELDDPGTYGRIVRDADGERRADRRGEGARRRHRRRSSRSARSTPAPTPSPPGRSPNALGAHQQRQRPGRVLPRRRAAADARRRAARSPPTGRRRPGVNLGVNDRVDLARVDRGGPPPHPRARTCAPASPSSTPRSTWIDAEVELAPDVTIEPGTSLRGATSVGAGSVIGPMTTLIDAKLGERVTVPALLPDRVRGRRRRPDRPLRLPAPGRQLGEGAKAGAFVEIKNSRDRRGRQGPPPLLRRRRRDRRGRQPRRRHDHRQLRRFPQTPDEGRQGRQDGG